MKNIFCKTDILIIGSGPAGSLSGYEILKKKKLKVIILEQGKQKRDFVKPYSSDEMDIGYYKSGLTPAFGRGNIVYAIANCVGGGSEINSGFFFNFPKHLLNSWKKKISFLNYYELNKNINNIKKNLNIVLDKKNEGLSSKVLLKGSKKLKLRSEAVPRWIKSSKINNKWSHKRYGMTETYIKMFKKKGGIIIKEIRAKKIIKFAKNKNEEIVVECIKNNKKIFIKTKYLICCGGAIFTPLFLRKSNIKENIGDSLMMHQMTRVVAKFKNEINEDKFGVPIRQINHFKPKMTFGCSISGKEHLALWMSDENNLNQIIRNYKKYSIYYSLINSSSKGKVLDLPFLDEPYVFYNLSKNDLKNHFLGLKRLSRILFRGGAQEIFFSKGNLGNETKTSFKNYNEVVQFLENKKNYIPEVSSIHLFSSVSMGKSREYPLDSYGKLKKFTNIYVNDSSILPSTTGVNPQGIIMAMAKRNINNLVKYL
jgi:choline dehydrogenase-like flavoprotein